MTLILRDPAPEPSGGGPAVPSAPPPPPPPPPPPAPAPVPSDAGLIPSLVGQVNSLAARNAELEAAERQRRAEAERAEQDRIAARGDAESARAALAAAREAHQRELEESTRQRQAIEHRSRTTIRDRELAVSLSAHPILEGTAPQLMALLRDRIDAHPEGDGYAVRTADFVPVADYVARELARPEYAHFLRPGTTGGAGTAGAHRAPPPDPAETPEQRRAAQLRAIAAEQRNTIGIVAHHGAPARN